ncbi:MAG: T9SS type A sorting domain-containing protein [Candidatus Cloacimonadaceae bacterium]|nr:T9SS type A sorting domain-containing protein [Candidatus Cloacimonadaceae bacterium]
MSYSIDPDWNYHYDRWNMVERPSYLAGNPNVIEDVLVTQRQWGSGYDTGWVNQPVIDFNPVVIDSPEGRTIRYHSDEKQFNRTEVYDQQNRLISMVHMRTGGGIENGCRYYYYYNDFDLPDSMFVTRVMPPNPISYKKINIRYDDLGRKLDEISYVSLDSLAWEQSEFATFYHSSANLPPGFRYKLHNPLYQLRTLPYTGTYLDQYHKGLYGNAMIDSIKVQSYSSQGWQSCCTERYLYTMETGWMYLCIEIWEDDNMGWPKPMRFEMSFDLQGYYLGQSWMVDDGFGPPIWGGLSYYWEEPVSVDEAMMTPPADSARLSIYPNPFHTATKLSIDLDRPAVIRFSVFNARGQKVVDLTPFEGSRGENTIWWDGRDEKGRQCSTGIYFVQVDAGGRLYRSRVVLLK